MNQAVRAQNFDFVHTGAGTLAGRYLRSFWQPVFRADDLPAGRALPLRMLSTLSQPARVDPAPCRSFPQPVL